jgi:hypothetical protein
MIPDNSENAISRNRKMHPGGHAHFRLLAIHNKALARQKLD